MSIEASICRATGARSARRLTRIQELWSGWGEIVRYELDGGRWPTVVVKHIQVPEQGGHLAAWDSTLGDTRKIRSYAVEHAFYKNYLPALPPSVRFAKPLLLQRDLFVLEDLDGAGFAGRAKGTRSLAAEQISQCLTWLAGFHGAYLGRDPVALWPVGTYWHLDTRPDELGRMADGPLKRAAADLDKALTATRFPTLVHGDAKVANFCFSATDVAAVDFQYVGGGCGLKDVAYFLGSCMNERLLAKSADGWLDFYFSQLGPALKDPGVLPALEADWRALWPAAWADFERFLLGWAPSRYKDTGFAADMTALALANLGAADDTDG